MTEDSRPKVPSIQQSGSGNSSQNYHNSNVRHTTVTGNNNVTISGDNNNVNTGDHASLRAELTSQGFEDQDIDELESFIDEEKGNFSVDEASRGEGRIGQWIKKSLSKVVKVGATQLFAQGMKAAALAVAAYFGVG